MKLVGKFQSARWGTVVALRAHYCSADGPTAIVLETADGEPLGKLSVNMYKPYCSHDSRDLPDDCFYVKRWSENEEIAVEALASGLFIERPDLPQATSGEVSAPVWEIRSPA